LTALEELAVLPHLAEGGCWLTLPPSIPALSPFGFGASSHLRAPNLLLIQRPPELC